MSGLALAVALGGGSISRASPTSAQPAASTVGPQSAASGPAFEIQAYDVDGNTILDQETIESAVYPYLGPQRSREDVNAARQALQKAYQSRGYQSVVVEIPPQDARTGIVKLHVIEAPVGRLRVVGSNYYSLDAIKEQVPSIQEGKVPDFNAAQKEVADLNRTADRQVTPLIRPGKMPGTVDIDLKVHDNLPVHGSVEVNNDHAQNTTPMRTAGTVSYSNLWQLGHTLTATAVVAPNKLSDSETFSGSYLAPIWGSPWSVLITGYSNNSNVPVPLTFASALGEGYGIGAHGVLRLSNWDELTQTLNLGADFKHSVDTTLISFCPPHACLPNSVDYVPLSVDYSLSGASGSSTVAFDAALTMGLRGIGSAAAAFEQKRAFARSNFVHVNISTDITEDAGDYGQIGLRFNEQLADGPLIPNEEFTAGGLLTVRGYLQSSVLADDGVFASLEIRTPSFAPLVDSLIDEPIFDEWRAYGFTDGAVAWVLDPLPEQTSKFRIGSFGVGTRFHALGHLASDFIFAVPMRDASATKAWEPYFQFSVKSEL
ncbi:MAG: ShlB/FhaC/HecB family hemolysin secretion/activation protein [Alphaproteobacteria bacterium]|nr:ShlB/FhaC/HecB family hemolysin secretion/activation protein [Alphaproteobacteria bacterium]